MLLPTDVVVRSRFLYRKSYREKRWWLERWSDGRRPPFENFFPNLFLLLRNPTSQVSENAALYDSLDLAAMISKMDLMEVG